MEDFVREALARLPLADAVLHLWLYVGDDTFLDSLYERNPGRCYPKAISFPVVVQLMASALLEHQGSGRASFESAQENGTLEASVWAAFQKLGNTPLAVSEALLAEGTTRLMQIFPDHDHAGDIPTSLAEFEIIPLDGKAIKKVAKRLKPLRGVSGGLLGGRALVAMHLRTGMALAMATHEDGEANDARFMPELLEQVRGLVPGCRLYVGDRQYCDLVRSKATISSFAITARTPSPWTPRLASEKDATDRGMMHRRNHERDAAGGKERDQIRMSGFHVPSHLLDDAAHFQ